MRSSPSGRRSVHSTARGRAAGPGRPWPESASSSSSSVPTRQVEGLPARHLQQALVGPDHAPSAQDRHAQRKRSSQPPKGLLGRCRTPLPVRGLAHSLPLRCVEPWCTFLAALSGRRGPEHSSPLRSTTFNGNFPAGTRAWPPRRPDEAGCPAPDRRPGGRRSSVTTGSTTSRTAPEISDAEYDRAVPRAAGAGRGPPRAAARRIPPPSAWAPPRRRASPRCRTGCRCSRSTTP